MNWKIKLWKENRIDKEYELEYIEILKGFAKSHYFKSFQEGFNFDRALRGYITDPQYLNSSFENDDYEKLADWIFQHHNCIEGDI